MQQVQGRARLVPAVCERVVPHQRAGAAQHDALQRRTRGETELSSDSMGNLRDDTCSKTCCVAAAAFAVSTWWLPRQGAPLT